MRFGIATRLGVGAVVLVAVMTTLTSYVFYDQAESVLIQHEIIDLQDETSLRARELQAGLGQVRAAALRIAAGGATRDLLAGRPPDDYRRLAADVLRGHRQIDALELLDWRGRPVMHSFRAGDAVTHEATGPDLIGSPALRAVRRDGTRVWFSPARGGLMTAAVAVRGRGDADSGVLIASIDFGRLTARFRKSPRHLVYLFDEAGRLLVDPDRLLGRDEGPENIAEVPQLGDVVADVEREENARNLSVVRGLVTAPLPKESGQTAMPGHGFWLVSSGTLPENTDCIALARQAAGLARQYPNVRFGRIDLRATRVNVSSPDLDALREVTQRIKPRPTLGEKLTGDADWSWNDPVWCESFSFQYVRFCVPSADAATYAELRGNDSGRRWFGLIMGIAREEISDDIREEFNSQVFLIAGLAGLAAVAGLLLSLRLTRPLKRITKAADHIARGEPAELSDVTARSDEIGTLARSFGLMVNRLTEKSDQLRDSEATTRGILSNAADAIITLDDRGRVGQFNLSAQRLFGLTLEEARGRHYREFVPRRDEVDAEDKFDLDDADSFQAALDSTSLTPDDPGIRREVWAKKSDGTVFPAEVSLNEVPLGGGQTIYTVILRDIGERKRHEDEITQLNADLERRVEERTAELVTANHTLEQARDLALESVRARDSFLATMSHELRTPLNAIIGYCEFLQENLEDAEPDEMEGDLKKIEQAGRHLLDLINDVLDLAKIEAGKMELEPRDFDAGDLLKEMQGFMQPLVRARGNRFALAADGDLGKMTSDRRRVRQVLLNLLSNANKFTDSGDITLSGRRLNEAGRDWLVFAVKDTGKGMKPEELRKLFTAFYQADSSSTRKHEGTGLGLTITRRFCNLMGGDVTVESEFNVGSTFTVRLPADARGPTPDPTPPPPTRPGSARGETILVIDDDADVRDLMSRFLTREGYKVRTAAGGEEGLKLARAEKPAAVTLDVMMPGVDGWAVLAALKRDPETADIPVIMATIVDDKTRGFALGAVDYITKPIDRGRLRGILAGLKADRPALVVEDDADTRELFARSLAKEGWQVEQAGNGVEALGVMRRVTPGVILLDLMMPEMDGFQFAERLRGEPAWADVPVFVVTAAEVTEEDRLRLNGRVRQILTKSAFSQGELLEEIRRRVRASADFNRPEGG